MITAGQLRGARAMLEWSREELADRAGISAQTIKRIELNGPDTSSLRTLVSIKTALEEGGIEFIPENGGGEGVRFRKRAEKS